jgi:hypothetical protein
MRVGGRNKAWDKGLYRPGNVFVALSNPNQFHFFALK